MSSDLTYLINGVDLDTELADTILTADTTWSLPMSTDRSPVQIPGRHGNTNTGQLPVYTESMLTIAIRVRVAPASQPDLEQLVNKIKTLIGHPFPVITRISGGITATAPAELVSSNEQDFITGTASKWLIVFALPGVFWREPVPGVTNFVPGVLDGAPMPSLAGSSGPVTDAIVQIAGPWTDPAIRCHHSGTGISWTGTVPAGQYLYLDPDLLRARVSNSPTAWTDGGTDVSEHLDYPAEGLLQLWPVVTPSVGDASIGAASTPTIQVDAHGTDLDPNSTVTIRARRSYL